MCAILFNTGVKTLKLSGALPGRVADVADEIGNMTLAATTLYIAFWVANTKMRVGYEEAACASCGYDIAGNASGRCPECGADLGAPRAIVRGHAVRWLPIAVGALLGAFGIAFALVILLIQPSLP